MALSGSQRAAIRHPFKWLWEKEAGNPGEIPRKELTCYTLGLMGQNHLYGMAGGNRFFHFCTNVLMLNPTTVGTLTGATSVFDAFNDPVAGSIIDNYRFKDGRKLLPWIKRTSPFIAVLAFLLFVNWNLPSYALRVLYCTVIYVLWDIFYSFQDAALWGMTAAIHPGSGQRARATQWADIGAFLGGLLPGLTMPMLSGSGAFGMTQQQIYLLFAVFMCLGGGFQSLFALGMTERVRSLPSLVNPDENAREKGQNQNFRAIWQNISCLRHNYILLLFLASEVLRSCTPNVADIYIFQQMTYQVGSRAVAAPVVIMIVTIFTGMPGSFLKFFATKIFERVGGMKRLIIIARFASLCARILTWAIGIRTLPMLILGYVVDSIAGLPGNIDNIAMRAMISDSVEYVEWKTGHRTEGITMSIRNLMAKLTGAIGSYIQGHSLRFLQFDARLVEQNLPQNAHFHQWGWTIFRLGPAFGIVMSLIPLLLLKYPDSLKFQIEEEMKERRAMAEAKKIAEELALTVEL